MFSLLELLSCRGVVVVKEQKLTGCQNRQRGGFRLFRRHGVIHLHAYIILQVALWYQEMARLGIRANG